MSSLFSRLPKRFGELLDGVRLSPETHRRLNDARQALERDEPHAAIAILDTIDRHDETPLLPSRTLRAHALKALGQFNEAARLLEGVLSQGVDDPATRLEIFVSLADVNEAIGPLSRAVSALRQALKLAPDDAELTLRLIRALEDEGSLDEAIHTAQLLHTLDPDALDTTLLVAQLRLRRGTSGDYSAAGQVYGDVLRILPEHPEALEGLARVYRERGEVAAALPLLQQALQVAAPEAAGRLYHAMGECYQAADETAAAGRAFEAAVQAEPGRVDAWASLAANALARGDLEAAEGAANAGLQQEPTRRDLRIRKGVSLLRQGQTREAAQQLSGLREGTRSPELSRAFAELSLAMNDPGEALALLREVLARDPGDREAKALAEAAVLRLAPNLPVLPEGELPGPAALVPFLDALGEALARHPLLSDRISKATALRQSLDTPLSIAVLGEFNAGKSTFINAFLAEDVLATGVLPTTSHVNVIRYGPRKVARWTHLDGRVEEISFAEAKTLTRQAPETIGNLEFCLPNPELRALHFWDTPGFNAPDDDHEERAQKALESADAVVWILDANQALSQTEFEHLQDLPNRREKLLVVLNKVDRLGGDDEALQAILAHVRDYLGEDVAGIYPMSTAQALAARRVDREDGPVADPVWDDFEGELREKILDRTGRLKSLEVITGLRGLLREALDQAEEMLERVNDQVKEFVILRRDFEQRKTRWAPDVGMETRSRISRELQDLRRQLGHEIRQQLPTETRFLQSRELSGEDRRALRQRLVRLGQRLFATVFGELEEAAQALDRDLVSVVENAVAAIGPPESRTLHRRLEGALAETAALRKLGRERFVESRTRMVQALVQEMGDVALDRVATARNESERDSLLQRLLAPPDASFGHAIEEWMGEILGVAIALCEHAERDLDIFSLDIRHRILNPFSAALNALNSEASTATAAPDDPA